jgi:hypothetical protein
MAEAGSLQEPCPADEGSSHPSASSSMADLSWWERYDVDLDFQTVEDICEKIFGVTLAPVAEGDDLNRRKSFMEVTSAIVERVVEEVSASSANIELDSLSQTLGIHPAFVSYNYERRPITFHGFAWLNRRLWIKRWKQHFSLIVIGHYDLDNLETVFLEEVPGFMHHVETCEYAH